MNDLGQLLVADACNACLHALGLVRGGKLLQMLGIVCPALLDCPRHIV